MTTGQNYVGGDSHATSSEQTANSALSAAQNQGSVPRPALTSDEMKEDFLKQIASDDESRESLFDLLYLIWDFHDSSDGTKLLADLFEAWLANDRNDLNKHRYQIRDSVSHFMFARKLKSEFEAFDNQSGYTSNYSRLTKGEVRNG